MASLIDLQGQELDEIGMEAQAREELYERRDAVEDGVVFAGFAHVRQVWRHDGELLAFVDSWERDWARADAACDREVRGGFREVARLGRRCAKRFASIVALFVGKKNAALADTRAA